MARDGKKVMQFLEVGTRRLWWTVKWKLTA